MKQTLPVFTALLLAPPAALHASDVRKPVAVANRPAQCLP